MDEEDEGTERAGIKLPQLDHDIQSVNLDTNDDMKKSKRIKNK